MKCSDAEKLIMNYMDNVLSQKDAERLNEHLKKCDQCREAFAVYEMMIDNFQSIEIVDTPVNFEQELMLKIEAVSPVYLTQKPISMEWIHSLIWGIFTVLFGTGIVLNVYRDTIMESISQNQYIQQFYNAISPIGNLIVKSINQGFNYIEEVSAYMAGFGAFGYLKIICGISILVLCGVEVWSKRSKVDA